MFNTTVQLILVLSCINPYCGPNKSFRCVWFIFNCLWSVYIYVYTKINFASVVALLKGSGLTIYREVCVWFLCRLTKVLLHTVLWCLSKILCIIVAANVVVSNAFIFCFVLFLWNIFGSFNVNKCTFIEIKMCLI